MVKQSYYQNVLDVNSKKSRLIKKKEAKGMLTSLNFKTGLGKIPFIGDCLF